MKHCFLINLASGKLETKNGLDTKIKESCEKNKVEYCILNTESATDANLKIKEFSAKYPNEEIRFYACGGDGTLCVTVNAIMEIADRDRISVGVIPVGTGNDFVRNFQPKALFMDIDNQINASPVKIDLIKCNDFYAVNMINIGFDCQVVCATTDFKRKKFIPLKLAYICGLVQTLIKKPGVSMTISEGGKEYLKKELLLTTFANGSFCGGGFHSNPHASLCDGKINALFVNDITRRKFVSLVGYYKKGTHLEGKFERIIYETKDSTYDIRFSSPTNISVDGEIVKVNEINLSCECGAISFLVPSGITLPAFLEERKIEELQNV